MHGAQTVQYVTVGVLCHSVFAHVEAYINRVQLLLFDRSAQHSLSCTHAEPIVLAAVKGGHASPPHGAWHVDRQAASTQQRSAGLGCKALQ